MNNSSHPHPHPHPAVPAAFERVKRHLKNGLAKGRWPPGARMPSEAELVEKFSVSRMTVNRALRELQVEGLVERRQGAGTFAAQLHRISSSLSIRDIHEEIVARGHAHTAIVHLLKSERATIAMAASLGVCRGDALFHSIIVHHENGVPIQCEDRFVNAAVAPDYLSVDFRKTTPTHYLLDIAPVWEAHYAVEAGMASATESKLLNVGAKAPCLIVTRRTVSRGRPVTWVRLVHPGDCYQIEGAFKP
jgi:GntR family transcriptional regulator, histidine utilization repressor